MDDLPLRASLLQNLTPQFENNFCFFVVDPCLGLIKWSSWNTYEKTTAKGYKFFQQLPVSLSLSNTFCSGWMLVFLFFKL